MFIHEAIKARTPAKPCIRRKAWSYYTTTPSISSVKIQPTNSLDGCIVYSISRKSPCHGWQPIAEDLTADDWEPVSL